MIRTRYIGPTDTKGARIRATDGVRQVTIPYPYQCVSTEDAHAEAASWLHDKLYPHDEGRFEYAVARSAKEDGYVFYLMERDGE
jgi:hypothetical protein